MTNLRMASLDQRVEAILTNPESYFAAARERAATIARIEVDAYLARRANARHTSSADRTGPTTDQRVRTAHRPVTGY